MKYSTPHETGATTRRTPGTGDGTGTVAWYSGMRRPMRRAAAGMTEMRYSAAGDWR
jgi:hypothetical protein